MELPPFTNNPLFTYRWVSKSATIARTSKSMFAIVTSSRWMIECTIRTCAGSAELACNCSTWRLNWVYKQALFSVSAIWKQPICWLVLHYGSGKRKALPDVPKEELSFHEGKRRTVRANNYVLAWHTWVEKNARIAPLAVWPVSTLFHLYFLCPF